MPEKNLREELAALFEREIAPHLDTVEAILESNGGVIIASDVLFHLQQEIAAIRTKLGIAK